MKRMTTGSMVFFLAVLVLTAGCGRTKELERKNQEQARVIAGLNEEMARLKEELNQLRAPGAPSAYPGGGSKNVKSFIK